MNWGFTVKEMIDGTNRFCEAYTKSCEYNFNDKNKMNRTELNEKAFTPFCTNGMHFWFSEDVGVSIIWGWGSYTENHMPKHSPDDRSEPMTSDTVELYPLGSWPNQCQQDVLEILGADEFPVGYVDLPAFTKVMARLSEETSSNDDSFSTLNPKDHADNIVPMP